MRPKAIGTDWGSCFRARAVWGLTAGLILVGSSSPLLGCDDGRTVQNPNHHTGLVEDCKILLEIRDELAGTGHLNWEIGSNIATWDGITVSGAPLRVSKLQLYDSRLTGAIPPKLGKLFQLQELELFGNELTGEIPAELDQLTQLWRLDLSNNQLTGTIPAELGRLIQLEQLYLHLNQLKGAIPPELSQLNRLGTLSLDANQLTGDIPAEMGQLVMLQQLDLSENQLTGAIPGELGQLLNLHSLRLHDNQLTGKVPPELHQLRRLQVLRLSSNELTGAIPAELGQLTQLHWLDLSGNQLTGPIPAELSQLTNVRNFELFGNKLTGVIPPELGQLPRVGGLVLHDNQLTGPIPAELGQLTQLGALVLGGNQLTGVIPAQLGQLTQLDWLGLSDNRLTGVIPAELGQLIQLRRLDLSGNQLTGEIPRELGQLTRLRWLLLHNNQLTGAIPGDLGQLTRLFGLHLQHNRLTGVIPVELSRLSLLNQFSFRGNLLTGSVPSELNHLPDVYVLNLTATRSGADRIDVSWDDPGDPAAVYEYRLWDETLTWTEWVPIGDPETKLRRGEGVTIEWTLTDIRTDAVYLSINVRVSNDTGTTTSRAEVKQLVTAGAPDPDSSENLFVPVLLTSAGRNNSFFTSELTLTNRGSEQATLHYTYTARSGGGTRTATDRLDPGRQRIKSDAIDYLTGLGIPIPGSGNRIGTLRVEVSGSSQVSVVTRTTTAVPDGRAGLAYPAIAEDEGFQEAVYLCGLRENTQDRSNVAFQNMGSPDDGPITLRTTLYSGEADDSRSRVVGEVTLQPGGFHQYSGLLGRLGSPAQGYVKVEKVEGEAPFYAYGVINDNFNSDGSFVFPTTASSLDETVGQTLPVIVETGVFTSELMVTNFSDVTKTVIFRFRAEAVQAPDKTATVKWTFHPGQQVIVPNVVDMMRKLGAAGIGPAGQTFAGALFATVAEGDMSGIAIGARTSSSDGRGGQYGVFYKAVPYGGAFLESAWVEALQQDEENRSNLALVNTGEVDDSPSVFRLDIYDGETGELANTVTGLRVAAGGWRQINGILGKYAPGTTQGYVWIRKISGNNPFLAYGVINDGGAPGQRSGDGAYLSARE